MSKDSIWTNETLEQFLLWLGYLNSSLNPFIYAFYNGDFRIAFYRLTFRACYRNQQNNVFKWRTIETKQRPRRKWTGNLLCKEYFCRVVSTWAHKSSKTLAVKRSYRPLRPKSIINSRVRKLPKKYSNSDDNLIMSLFNFLTFIWIN